MKQIKMKQKGILSTILVFMVVMSMALFSVNALAQSSVDLGTAGDFVILAKSGISTTGITSIVGDIGVSPIDSTAITGFGLIMDVSNEFATSSLINGNAYAADYTLPTPTKMTTAISDMGTAYTDAAGRTLPDYTELGAGNIGGMTLTPGLYKWGTGVIIPADVTISGSSTDIWIFQIAGTLDISSAAQVKLIGGADANNIFWQVADQTTLGTTSVFNGNILCQTAIVLNTGAVLNGRALAQTAVTLDANTVSLTAAASPVLTTITLTPASANLTIGSTQQLNAAGFDQFGLPMDATINYTTSNSSVATVDAASGLVTAVIYGSATITATSGNILATSMITVETAAPILNSIGSKSVTQDTLLNFTITATSPEGFNLTFAIAGTPATATFTDNFDGTATFSWMPISSDVGVINVSFIVTDGIKSTSEVVAITVNTPAAPAPASTSGGGGSSGSVCTTNWVCSDWTACSNEKQTRTCNKEMTTCYAGDKPMLIRSCANPAPVVLAPVKAAKTAESTAIAPKEPVNLGAESTADTTVKKGFFSSITGMAVNGLKSVSASWYGLAAVLLIAVGLVGYMFIFKTFKPGVYNKSRGN